MDNIAECVAKFHDVHTVGGETVRPHRFAGKPFPQSVEQMCRNLLEQAIGDDLIQALETDDGCKDPQRFTSGDLCGMANLLAEYLRK